MSRVKTPAEMTQDERAEVMIKFKRMSDLEKLVRREYLRHYEETGEGHEMVEVSPGRTTQSWGDSEAVLAELLIFMEYNEDIPASDLIQPLPPGKLIAALKKHEVEIPESIGGDVEVKQGDPFTRLKPQADPEMFRE